MVTRRGSVYSPWGEVGGSFAQSLLTNKPFYVKERLAEQLQATEDAEAVEEDGTELVEEEEGEDEAQDSAEASPLDYVLLVTPESLLSQTCLIPDSSRGGAQRSLKSAKNAAKDAKNRAKRRAERAAVEREENERILSEGAARKCRDASSLTGSFSLKKDAEVGSGGYSGKKVEFERVHTQLPELEKQGIKVFDWDPDKGSVALLDSDSLVCGVLGGWPQNTAWGTVNSQASAAVRDAREGIHFSDKQKDNRRADCPAVAFGVSFGGGATRPGNLRQSSKKSYQTMTALLGALAFARIVGFSNCLFMAYAYKTYVYSKTNLDKLCVWNRKLKWVFKRSAWAACTVNFGPRTVTYPHLDQANLCFGWCAITALGDFNPDYGGHLVLWDLGLAVRFPPGATILIPSALLVHSNVPVQPGEERFSFVQYSSAGTFRWVENGFMSDLDFNLRANAAQKAQRAAERKQRWTAGLQMFSCWADIQAGNWKGDLL